MTDDVFRQVPKKKVADEVGESVPNQNPGQPQGRPASFPQGHPMSMPYANPNPNLPQGNPMERVHGMQEAIAAETGRQTEMPQQGFNSPDVPFQMSGKIPEAFKKAMQGQGVDVPTGPMIGKRNRPTPDLRIKPGTGNIGGSEALQEALSKLDELHNWEEIDLPSKGKFYDSIPPSLNVRAMTGEEEQILATPRHVRKGKAIDMIFNKCVRENINTGNLLSVDRTYLLIFLRGISYTPEYDVEIKCPECSTSFNNVINLSTDIEVTDCPDDFGPGDLHGVLPTTGFSYRYRLATGQDEQAVTSYRESRLANFDQSDDDTLLYRTSILLENIDQVTDRKELGMLLKKLPINDVAHLRNVINDPPFGIKTEIGIICPACSHEFKIDLPLEAGFFFPRKKSSLGGHDAA